MARRRRRHLRRTVVFDDHQLRSRLGRHLARHRDNRQRPHARSRKHLRLPAPRAHLPLRRRRRGPLQPQGHHGGRRPRHRHRVARHRHRAARRRGDVRDAHDARRGAQRRSGVPQPRPHGLASAARARAASSAHQQPHPDACERRGHRLAGHRHLPLHHAGPAHRHVPRFRRRPSGRPGPSAGEDTLRARCRCREPTRAREPAGRLARRVVAARAEDPHRQPGGGKHDHGALGDGVPAHDLRPLRRGAGSRRRSSKRCGEEACSSAPSP